MRVTAVIPARFASTRFPGKPLADILGKPMIQRVYERTAQCGAVDQVIVATDDARICDAVRSFGGEVRMTRDDHPTGTDRLAEVAENIEADLIVNVQGDEPLIDPRMIEAAVAPLRQDAAVPMGTLKSPIATVEEFTNHNVVKVTTDLKGFALTFSRSPIPHPRDVGAAELVDSGQAFKHIGLYVYRRDFLLAYPRLPLTPLEQLEKLEQLRALEHGYRIRVVATDLVSQGVDTPEDLEQVKAALRLSSGHD